MRRLALMSCVALAGCASTNAATGTQAPVETVRVSGNPGMMMVETHPAGAAVVSTVGFPLDRVWGALRVAYDSLALPVSSMDVATRTIATQSLRARRRLGNVALSRYVNCGNTQGGASADSYELMLSVTTQAAAGESGTTRLTTNVEAQGRPITLAAEYARCTSTGVLETRLRELVTAQLNR